MHVALFRAPYLLPMQRNKKTPHFPSLHKDLVVSAAFPWCSLFKTVLFLSLSLSLSISSSAVG
jgi:hypothetical protein